MDDLNTIEILDENGKEITVEVKTYFNLETTGKDYIVYTRNEMDGEKLKLYVGFLTEDDTTITIEKVTDPSEWDQIKKYIKILLKEGKVEQ